LFGQGTEYTPLQLLLLCYNFTKVVISFFASNECAGCGGAGGWYFLFFLVCYQCEESGGQMDLDLQGSQQIVAKLRMKRNNNNGDSPVRVGGGDEAWSTDEPGGTLDSPVWRRSGMSTQQRVQSNGKSVQKIRQIEWVIHLRKVADGLMTKLHRLRQILGSPETGSLHYPDSFWKSGIFPDLPKLCQHVARKFPEHPAKLQLEKVHGLCLLSFFFCPHYLCPTVFPLFF